MRMRRQGGPKEKRIKTSRTNRMIAALSVCILVLSCVFAAASLRRPTRIRITAQEGSGAVTYRGAMVNSSWCNPSSGLSPDGAWTFDPSVSTYTATNSQPLEVELPAGEERSLVFTVGPDEGAAIVEYDGEQLELDLFWESFVENGHSFALPGEEPSSPMWYALPALALVLFAVLLVFAGAEENGGVQARSRTKGIDVYRFVFALVIMLHHLGWQFTFDLFGSGYLAVDLFFIVSGYFLAAHYEREQEKLPDGGVISAGEAAARYAVGRWKRMFLHHSWSFCVAAVAVLLLGEHTWKQVLFDNWPEFLMLEETGIGRESVINGVGWYCSALFLASFAVYYLLGKNKRTHVCVITPIACVIVFSYFYNTYGHLNRYLQNPLLICDGVFRGFAEVSIGCVCFYAVKRMKSGAYAVVPKRSEPWLYGLLEAGCFCALMVIMWRSVGYKPGSYIALDFAAIPIMAIFVTVVLSEKSVLLRLWRKCPSGFLGKLSFSIFLNHTVILGLLTRYMVGRPVVVILSIYFGVTIGYSILTMLLIERLERRIFRKA